MRAIAILVLLPLAACNVSDRDGATVASNAAGASRSFDVADFAAVELRGPDDVEVTIGDRYAVRAEGAAEVLDRLEVDVRGDRLRIGRRSERGGWFNRDRGARVFVTMPRITAASVSGSGDMRVARAEGNFQGAVSGSGDLAIVELLADDADLAISGSGNLSAAGRARSLDAAIQGSGDIDAGGLSAQGGSFSVAGSGDIRANVNGEANVSIMGSGDVELGGGARCRVSRMGSGEARCG